MPLSKEIRLAESTLRQGVLDFLRTPNARMSADLFHALQSGTDSGQLVLQRCHKRLLLGTPKCSSRPVRGITNLCSICSLSFLLPKTRTPGLALSKLMRSSPLLTFLRAWRALGGSVIIIHSEWLHVQGINFRKP